MEWAQPWGPGHPHLVQAVGLKDSPWAVGTQGVVVLCGKASVCLGNKKNKGDR